MSGGSAFPPGYERLDELGRGGMGVVYRARDTAFDRDVAVKLLQEQYPAASEAARRFVAEARITGQLQHPGIPAVHQVGTLPDGRPFLAMKLIKGRTLSDLLKTNPPNTLAVFEAICQAVGYAHAHGVIHRDLKPLNVMVGAFGEVQVMDWGLAKVLAGREREPAGDAPGAAAATEIRSARDSDTQSGDVMGTPAYMSPEQAGGEVEKVDARSDVFGLGAILCVTLTGSPPYVGADARSTHLMAVRGDLGGAVARLDGCGADPDLVGLCKRCLAAKREDRPADAGAVAAAVAELRAATEDRARRAELDRLAAEVRAAGERKRRRHLLAAAGVAAGVLAAGAGAAVWQAVRATTAERAADAQVRRTQEAEQRAVADRDAARAAETAAVQLRETANEVLRFMGEVFAQGSADGQASPTRQVNRTLTVREAMDYAAKDIEGRFRDRPGIEAAVRTAIGRTYFKLGAYPDARAQLTTALNQCERVHGPDHPETLRCVRDLALLPAPVSFGADERLYRRALTGREAVLGPDHPDTLESVRDLAVMFQSKQELAAAEPLYRRALAGRERALGPDHPDTLQSVRDLGRLCRSKRDYATAERLYRRALDGREQILGPDHPDTLESVQDLGLLYRARGDGEAAAPYFRRSAAGCERVFGPDHPSTLAALGLLARLYFDTGRYADAVPLFDRAGSGFARRPEGEGFTAVLLTRTYQGLALLRAGQTDDAEPHLLAGAADGPEEPRAFGVSRDDRRRLAMHGLVALYRADRPAAAAAWRAKLAALPPEVAPQPRPAR